MTTLLIFCVIFLICFSAYFSVAEASLLGCSQEHLYRLDKNKHQSHVNVLQSLLQNKEEILSVILLGNNLFNTMASSVGAVAVMRILNSYNILDGFAVLINTVLMTVFIFLFGEIVPKTLVLRNPMRVALFVAPTLKFFWRFFYPFVILTNSVVALIVKIFGLHTLPSSRLSVQQELKMAIESQHRQGRVFKRDRDMFAGLLNLWTTEIREVMRHRGDVDFVEQFFDEFSFT